MDFQTEKNELLIRVNYAAAIADNLQNFKNHINIHGNSANKFFSAFSSIEYSFGCFIDNRDDDDKVQLTRN